MLDLGHLTTIPICMQYIPSLHFLYNSSRRRPTRDVNRQTNNNEYYRCNQIKTIRLFLVIKTTKNTVLRAQIDMKYKQPMIIAFGCNKAKEKSNAAKVIHSRFVRVILAQGPC